MDYVLISALQHYQFCPRQCALIHLEQLWEDNYLTVQGEILHDKVDSGVNELRGEVFTTRSLRLGSEKYRLTGVADVVEFHKSSEGASQKGKQGKWLPCPVEYKRGASKLNNCDRIQLCAQALCLEEMLGLSIPKAALWYNRTKMREWVELSNELREETVSIINAVHLMFEIKRTPKAIYEKKCHSCSLLSICGPQLLNDSTSIYFEKLFKVDNK